jgi:hypothetical protein
MPLSSLVFVESLDPSARITEATELPTRGMTQRNVRSEPTGGLNFFDLFACLEEWSVEVQRPQPWNSFIVGTGVDVADDSTSCILCFT